MSVSPGDEYVVGFITADGNDEALKISRALVEERLAACCNVLDGVTSVYRWKGNVEQANENLIIFKTRKELFTKLARRVKELHSYDVPEVVCFPVSEGLSQYLDWLGESIA